MKRHWTNYITTANNTGLQQFAFPTEDDYRVRHVKSVYSGLQVTGFSIALYTSGQEFSVIDTTRFAAGNIPVELEFDAMERIQLYVGTQDLAGLVRTNVPIVIAYEVDSRP